MIEVDAKKVLQMFSNLSTKKQQAAINGALRKGSQILQKESREILKRNVNRISTVHISKRGKRYSLSSGIKFHTKNKNESKIYIMGDFRLKFFEMGTKIRPFKTRKGDSGKITENKFFTKARRSKEKEIFQSMNRLLSESIQKVASK